jgi:septal ring factor EnvC (AmiA/AmiB activator)
VKWLLITVARHRRELASQKRGYDRMFEEINGRHADLQAKLADSVAAEGALARQIHTLAQPVEPTDACIDDMNRLLRELHDEKKRADLLQARLDDAFSLDAPAVAAGAAWQERRETKLRYDK